METTIMPLLSLDLKRQRIRIHRHTLRLLNDPKYVNLLVNPEAKIIAVQAQAEKTSQTHKIAYRKHHNADLYSTELIRQLQTVNTGLKSGITYRIPGRIYPKRGIAVFSMDECTPVDTPLPLSSPETAK